MAPSDLFASPGQRSVAPKPERKTNPRIATALCAALSLLAFAQGCSTYEGASLESISAQNLEYFPYQVKGYQNTYPHRTILVLMPVDARTPRPSMGAVAALGDKSAVGVATDMGETVVQRLYSEPLAPIVQSAIARAAEEAGLRAVTATADGYDPQKIKGSDYVLASKVTQCWVEKHRASSGRYGPNWHTTAEFTLSIRIYKPPFRVPFWEGTGTSTYNDPALGSPGLLSEDDIRIYDEPGQVLSVALTRAVAAIFEHADLRTLIFEDPLPTR